MTGILLGMPGRAPEVELFDRRLAAALLIATGDRTHAIALLRGVPQYDRATALNAVFAMLVEPVTGLDLDAAAMEVCGIPERDGDAMRSLMRAFEQFGSLNAAKRYAARLLELVPNDIEGRALSRRLSAEQGARVTTPSP